MSNKSDIQVKIESAPFCCYAWTQDFIKALASRPKIIRVMLRIIFGKYAYREFIGIVDTLISVDEYFNYELESMDYHKDKVRNDFLVGAKKY